MKLRYDADSPHQLAAVSAIVDIFDGQQPAPPCAEVFQGGGMLTVDATPNRLHLTETALLANLQAVQKRHNESGKQTGYAPVVLDRKLAKICHDFGDDAKNGLVAGGEVSFPNFSLEMETGTGKTYVFLRAIRELAMRRGFLKFIIITPTVAVRENTLAALATTDNHLGALYRRMPLKWHGYKSDNLSAVSGFARAGDARVLIMTLASFNKAANVMLHHIDKMGGDLPMAYLQATRPVLILDEPQNMETDLSEESLARLNPLCALRFSATHKTPHNMIFRLSPGNASAAKMVKQIQVGAVIKSNQSMPIMELIKTDAIGEDVFSRIKMNVRQKSGDIKQQIVKCLPWDDLYLKTRLPQYRGYVIRQIDRDPDKVFFANGKTLAAGGDAKKDIFRAQIKMTIEEHFSRQEKLLPHGIKVLSLFFIDRVENYASEDGIIRRIFEEEYEKARHKLRGKNARLREILDVAAAEVHDGYFAVSKGGNTEGDAASFNLIMRDKESLLSFAAKDDGEDERRKKRVAFIFSHSALREGWDNPNIFQICTLNESISVMRKRQELGRGLRLCVNQNGERQPGEHNILTVIANESYEQYARDYQNEMAEDYRHLLKDYLGGRNLAYIGEEELAELKEKYPGIIPQKPQERATSAKTRKNPDHLRREKDDKPFFSPDFINLWERISHQTRFVVDIDDKKLAAAAAAGIIEASADIPDPKITYIRARLEQAKGGKVLAMPVIGARSIAYSGDASFLPDMPELMADMLKQYALSVHLSPRTLLRVFLRAVKNEEQAKKARENPVGWAATAAEVICREVRKLKTEGVRYERTGQSHQWRQMFANDLADEDRDAFALYYAATNGKGKPSKNSIADFVACDSQVEQIFAEGLAKREDIKLFVKLPRWFSVPTPVGKYNPDWAILLDDGEEEKLYLISETKAAVKDGKIQWEKLRAGEEQKIRCAAKHFGSEQLQTKGALDGVDYLVAGKAEDIKRQE